MVTPERGFDPAVGLLSACQQNSCVATVDRGYPGEAETVRFSAVQGQTYFFTVDCWTDRADMDSTRGGFVIGVLQP